MLGYPVVSVIVVVVRSPADENHWEDKEDDEDGAGVDVDGEDGETCQWSWYWGGREGGLSQFYNNEISLSLVNTGILAWNIFNREPWELWDYMVMVEWNVASLLVRNILQSAGTRPDQWRLVVSAAALQSPERDSWYQPQLEDGGEGRGGTHQAEQHSADLSQPQPDHLSGGESWEVKSYAGKL